MGLGIEHRSRVRLSWTSILAAAGIMAGTGIVSGVAFGAPPPPPRIRSVVRTDSHGRLVRTVIVSPQRNEANQDDGDASERLGVSEIVEAAAKRHDVDPLLVHSMIQVESNYNPYAVSSKGAQGLMQLMPDTAKRFGVQNSFDVKENIEGGVRYLKYLNSLFPDDPALAIAAYNAGEGAVWKYGNKIPPYRETVQYVSRVGARYDSARKKSGPKKAQEVETAGVPAASGEPVYSPITAFIDSEGRLHLRTGPAAETP